MQRPFPFMLQRALAGRHDWASGRGKAATTGRVVRWVSVTAPREVLPGRSYLLTRRCTQRQFLLKPSPRTNQLVRYCLAVAASKTGVLLHAVCFMSNHWHGVVTDPFARLPEFLEHFHRLLAKAQNATPRERCPRRSSWRSRDRRFTPSSSWSDLLVASPTQSSAACARRGTLWRSKAESSSASGPSSSNRSKRCPKRRSPAAPPTHASRPSTRPSACKRSEIW